MLQSTEPLKNKKWKADDMPDQNGRIIMITGANSGLGYHASLELARHNATVIMTSRDMERGREAVKQLQEEVPDATVDLFQLDLASFDSIHNCAKQIKEKYEMIHVLINNAGVMQPPRRETEEGFELQFGVNHLGHFLLTQLLFPLLEAAPDARIINQSSIAHLQGRINFNDLNSEESYSRTAAYGQSKLANLLFTYELHRRLENRDIKAIGVHPGYTDTNLQQNGPTVGGKSFLSRLYTITNKLIAQDVSMGILPMLYAATEEDVESGNYIGPKRFGGSRGHAARIKSNQASYDEETAKRLWDVSEQLTGTTFLSKNQ